MTNCKIFRVFAMTLSFFAAACVPHIHDTFNVDSDSGATLDAQQRLVLVTHHAGRDKNQTVVCAEPSPDAMSAIAAAAAGAGGNGQVQANLSLALSQSAASIGIRTPTIQLLRDGLYRACEGYLNGILDEEAYQVILRNYDRVMVSLLAIDAAGGFPHPGPVTISGGNVQVSTDANAPASPPSANQSGTPPANSQPPAANQATANTTPPANTVVNAPNITGLQNGDQVIKTVVDYMLDNQKWLDAVCLDQLEAIANLKTLPPGDIRYQALQDLMYRCRGQLPDNIRFRAPRLFTTDEPPPPSKPTINKPAINKPASKAMRPSSAQVTELQTALMIENYFDHQVPTGTLDASTKAALAKFQAAQNPPITDEPGTIGPKTLAAIQKLRAPKSP